VESGTAAWHITIPANTTGWISDAEYSASHLKPAPADDSGITAAQGPDGEKGVNLMAGTYEFKAELK